jgi:hypothetical protein
VGLSTLDRRLAAAEARLPAVDAPALPADPLALAGAVGFAPDPWQRGVLASASPRIALCCSRQSGKSTVSALLALDAILRGELALVLSPTERQSAELLRKARGFLADLGPDAPPAVSSASAALELRNGGRLLALPGHDDANIRGFSGVALLLIDEAARVADDLYRGCRPMLAVSGGRLVLLSTPWGRRGFFWQTWDAGAGWERVEVLATACPRISPEFLEEERRTLGDLFFRSEYMCEFVDTVEQVFDSAMVDAAVSPLVRPLFPAEAA